MSVFSGVKDAATEKLLRAAGPQMAEALEKHTAVLAEINRHQVMTNEHLSVTALNTKMIAEQLGGFNASLIALSARMDRLDTAMVQIVIAVRDLQKWSRVQAPASSIPEAPGVTEHGQSSNGPANGLG